MSTLKILSLAGLALLCACDNVATDPVNDEELVGAVPIEPLAATSVAFFTEAECAGDWVYAPPPPGSRFDYVVAEAEGRPDDTVVRAEEIAGTQGRTVDYRSITRMADTVLETIRLRSMAGLLPVDSDTRRWSYRGLDEDRIFALAPGQAMSFVGVETATLDGQERTLEGPLTLTFVGCATGTDRIPAAVGAPLRIYRLQRFWQTSDGVHRGEYEIALSERWGWRMMDRDGSSVGVVVRAEAE